MDGVRRGGAYEQVSRSVRNGFRVSRAMDNPSGTFGFRLNGGVYRGGQVESWGQVLYFRSGYRRGARALGFTSSSLGFLCVNGGYRADRGGRYGLAPYYERSGYRDRSSLGSSVVGFPVNGVIRPAYVRHELWRYRCAYRYGSFRRSEVWNGWIGFRLNGAVRGGAYNNSSDRCICAGQRRNTYKRSDVNSGLGFL